MAGQSHLIFFVGFVQDRFYGLQCFSSFFFVSWLSEELQQRGHIDTRIIALLNRKCLLVPGQALSQELAALFADMVGRPPFPHSTETAQCLNAEHGRLTADLFQKLFRFLLTAILKQHQRLVPRRLPAHADNPAEVGAIPRRPVEASGLWTFPCRATEARSMESNTLRDITKIKDRRRPLKCQRQVALRSTETFDDESARRPE